MDDMIGNTNDIDKYVRCERLRNLLSNLWVLPDVIEDAGLIDDIKDPVIKIIINNIIQRSKDDRMLLEIALDPETSIDNLKKLYHDK